MPHHITSTKKFEVTINGKTYQCESTIRTSKDVLDQDIRVIGVGHKRDPASYGRKWHRPGSMDGIAELIAVEIIHEASATKPTG